MLVEHAVIRQEVLAVDGSHPTVGAHGTGVREISVEPRCADEGDDPVSGGRDLVERLARSAHETRSEEQILGGIPRDRELREDDEVGPLAARQPQLLEELGAIALEIADDHVQLRECEPQGFSLIVTNRVYRAGFGPRNTSWKPEPR